MLLATLFAVNVYRAATQSLTVDEAFTYNAFLSGGPPEIQANNPYNVNLNSLLMGVSVRAFPLSELTVRLPAVLGGLIYFSALFLLCRRLFGESMWLMLAVSLSSLNPFLLDYLSAARGYGLAMAFLTLGIYLALRCLDAEPESAWKYFVPAGVAFGLAAGSHVTAIFAVVALEGTLIVMRICQRRGSTRLVAAQPGLLLGTTVIVSLAILWEPMRNARHEYVDGVLPVFRDGIRTLTDASLLYRPTAFTSHDKAWRFVHRNAWCLLPLLLACLTAAATTILLRWRRGIDANARALLLFTGGALITFLLLRVEPPIAHHGFFALRRLLFTLPLLSVAAPLVARALPGGRVTAALLWLVVIQFALQFNVQSYHQWEFDAGVKTLLRSVPRTGPPVTIGVDWPMHESANFYRKRYRLSSVAEAMPWGPQCLYDYYLVHRRVLPSLARFSPVELAYDPVSGTVLAELPEVARRRLDFLRQAGVTGKLDCMVDLIRPPAVIEIGKPEAKSGLLRSFMGNPDQDEWLWTFERPAFLLRPPAQDPQPSRWTSAFRPPHSPRPGRRH